LGWLKKEEKKMRQGVSFEKRRGKVGSTCSKKP
jgi:hypothetical protein